MRENLYKIFQTKMNLQLRGPFPFTSNTKFLFALSIICISFASSLKAEITQITHQTGSITTIEDLYLLEIHTNTTNPTPYSLKLSLKKQSREIYKSQTGQFLPTTNINILNHHLLNPISIQRPLSEELSGEYLLQIEVINSLNQITLVDQIRLSAQNTEATSEEPSKKAAIELSGTASIYGQYSDRQGFGSSVPQEYIRAELNPNLNIGGIPFGLDVLYSTEQSAFKQSINRVAFRFDANQFRAQMMAKFQEKMMSNLASFDEGQLQVVSDIKDKLLKKQFPKLDKWKEELKGIDIKQYEKQLTQLQSLTQILGSPQIEESLNKLKSLQDKEDLSTSEKANLKQLTAFKTEIEKLRAKEKEIKALKNTYEQLSKTYKKYQAAQKYANSNLIRDPSFLKKGLKDFNFLSKGQRFLNGIEALTIGTSYPYYSRLSLSSLNLDGIHVELNPGPVYLSASYGKTARFTLDSINLFSPRIDLAQNTLATKFGLGNKYDSHLHFVYININDRASGEAEALAVNPSSNRIIGTDAQVSLFQNNLTLGGEFMTSLYTRDMTMDEIDGPEFRFQNIPVNKFLGEANNSSSFDIAWRAFGDFALFKGNTNVKASIEEVGPSYFTLGAPNLLNDIFRWKTEFRQSLFKNRFHVSAFARRDENNLDPLLTSSTSSTTSYGISGQLVLKSGLSLNGSYAPYAQNNSIAQSNDQLSSDATMLSLNLGIPVKLGNASSYTQLSYLNHDLTSNIPNIDYDLEMYGITQSINFNTFSLNGTFNYTPNQIIGDKNQEVISFNGSGSISLFKAWQNTFGYQYLGITGQESRSGFYFTSTFPIAKFADFELRAQRNIYDQVEGLQSFNDYVVNAGLRIRFGVRKQVQVNSFFDKIEDTLSQKASENKLKPKELSLQEKNTEEVIEPEVTKIDTPDFKKEAAVEAQNKDTASEKSEKAKALAEKLTKEEASEIKANNIEEIIVKETTKRNLEKLAVEEEKPSSKPEEKTLKIISRDDSNHYKIFLGAGNSPNRSFFNLMSIGPVTSEESENVYLYYVGNYRDLKEAGTDLRRAKKLGYSKAKLFRFENGVLVEQIGIEDLE
jgi:hypothetical protein